MYHVVLHRAVAQAVRWGWLVRNPVSNATRPPVARVTRLAQCERDVRAALVGQATVARSQPYYLDITHPLGNKGEALSTIAKLLAVPLTEIAVIGDGHNDIAMFERSGFSIAMGNANPEVRQAADFVTGSNRDDGFAQAVKIIISERPNAPAAPAAPAREGSPA